MLSLRRVSRTKSDRRIVFSQVAVRLGVLSALTAMGCSSLSAPKKPERPPTAIHLRLIPPADKAGTGRIMMDCAFDGQASSCRLDTGAGDKVLVPDASIFSAYKPVDAGDNENDLGIDRPVDVIHIDHLAMGGTDFGRIDAKRSKGTPGAPAGPLVGAQVVARRGFVLRFSEPASLTVDGPAPQGSTYALLPFDKDKHLLMKASIGGGAMKALFDTGAGITEIDRGYVAAHPKDFSLMGTMRIAGRPDAEVYEAASLSLGGLRFDKVAVLAADFSFFKKKTGRDDLRLLLGYNVITRADWYFDLARRRWIVSNRR